MKQENKLNVKKPELLAPCGSPEAVDAAISGGADAVYLGGTLLNARMNARNFDREALSLAVEKCHKYGVSVYVTINTQVYDKELRLALEYVGFLYSIGVDALIVADIGLSSLIRKYYPDFELHASTQMTAHNLDAVTRLYSEGFKRVVIARETSAGDIKTICENTDAEIEMFVHGAICVCHSGQCLMSSMLGGRSGNRGECAQPCRMKYDGGYPISMKDMCLAVHIPEIIKSGVASLKIEGRMKSPSYVFGVTKIYRRLIDENRGASGREMSELANLFSRSGFTDGYYTSKINQDMLGVRSEKDKSDTQSTRLKIVLPEKPFHEPIITAARENKSDIPSKIVIPRKKPTRKIVETARFNRVSQIPDSTDFAHIYLPLDRYESAADGVTLPPVIFDSELSDVKRRLDTVVSKGARHAMVSNIGQFSLVKEFGLIPHIDYRMNIFNTVTANELVRMMPEPPESALLSAELTLPQIRDIYFEDDVIKGAVIYGRIPPLTLEKRVGKSSLRDSRGAVFPVISENRRDIIVNSVPVYMAEYKKRLDDAGIEERHYLFTTESRADVLRVIYAYKHAQTEKDRIRRIK